ncbi:hypothetical protein BaRGS_00027781 [Batillaria attramentaria]|uniref:Major facilitator superfamily (MFS) profile domain-containing protein n=1 Tax=Batillaria attramentaria TaxID=370345 RepID=A0ABD0K0X3_9CAEN
MTHPVDRGWAWVVLVASLGNRYVSGALVYLVGVIHVELLNKFHKNATTTAWAGAIFSSLQMLGGPLATWFVDNYGCRITMVTGAVLLCAGFTASAFAPSISVLVVTYGLIAVFLVISFNFSRLLGLASGISVSASAVGILSGSLITQSLIDTYGLSGAFLLIGALSLHHAVFAMVYRPTPYEGKRLAESRKLTEANPSNEERTELFTEGEVSTEDTLYEDNEQSGNNGSNSVEKDHHEMADVSDNIDTLGKSPDVKVKVKVESSRTQPSKADPQSCKGDCRCNWASGRLRQQMEGLLPLVKNRAFVCHCVAILFASVSVAGIFLHLPEYSKTLGTDITRAATLFVGVGIFSFVSRLGSGYLITGLKVNALHLSVFLSAASAISTSLFPLYSGTYLGQMVFACLFGLSTGGFNTLINVLTVELVGFGDTLAMAYGMGVFVMGVGYVAGPPLAGVIVDSGGTYQHSFIFLGLAMFAAAVFDLLAKVVHTPHTTDRQVTGIVKMESSEAVDTLLPKGN